MKYLFEAVLLLVVMGTLVFGCSANEQRSCNNADDCLAGKDCTEGICQQKDTNSKRTIAVVGPKGGTLKLGKVSLEVPVGALDKAVSITIKQIETTKSVPKGLKLIQSYQLEPEGLQFKKPVLMSFTYHDTGNLEH